MMKGQQPKPQRPQGEQPTEGAEEYKWLSGVGCLSPSPRGQGGGQENQKSIRSFAFTPSASAIAAMVLMVNGLFYSSFVPIAIGSQLAVYKTTEANELMAEIHNNKKRMPVVLSREEEGEWIGGMEVNKFADRKEVELRAVAI